MDYLPIFRPGDTVTFSVTAAVVGGQLVQVGTADRSVTPAAVASTSVVGVAGHDAAIGDKVTVEVGKPVHLLKAAGAVTRGQRVEPATAGAVAALTTGTAYGVALTSAVDGTPVEVIQL